MGIMGVTGTAGQRFPDPEARTAPSRSRPSGSEVAQTVSALFSKRVPSDSQNASPSSEMPKDEVEVQRDSSTNGEIVIRYVNGSGELILQVPSAQVLNLARAIDSGLEREAREHANAANAAVVSRGGKVNGH